MGEATIEGVVVNERAEAVDYVEAVGTVSGEYEEEYYDSTEDLESGGDWQFAVEMSSYYEDIDSYEVTVNDEPMYGN